MDGHFDSGEMTMGTLVNRQQTTVHIRAWHEAHADHGLSSDSLAVLWAQAIQEHGLQPDGLTLRFVFCWNLGNRRVYGAHDWCLLSGAWECAEYAKVPPGAEILGPREGCPAGQVAYLLPSRAQKFCAFPDLATGVRTHLEFLAERYPLAHRAMLEGDPAAFVRELKRRGYFTGDESAYSRAVCSLVGRYHAWASGEPVEPSELAPGPHTQPAEWGPVDAATVLAGIFSRTEGEP